MRRLPPLSTLRAFEAAARHGSFKLAAAELSITPTAVSHSVRALEDFMEVKLFARQVRQVQLTDAGTQLYPVLQKGFDAFEAELTRLMRPQTRAKVTISATNAFTAKWLVPRMAAFRSEHANIDLQLHASDALVDLADPSFDIAIRYGKGNYPGADSEALFADVYAPVVNPMLAVETYGDLAKVPLIHFDWQRVSADNPTWLKWFAKAGVPWDASRPQLRFSDEGHAIQAAVAGQGIALLSVALVAGELAAGQLRRPFGPTLPGFTYHVTMQAQRTPSMAVAAVAAWLRRVGARSSG